MKWRVEDRADDGRNIHYMVSWHMLYDDEKRAIIKGIAVKVLLWAISVGLLALIYYRF